jgi:hypothetical protein
MFPQQPQQQFRTAGADVQIFYGDSAGSPLSRYLKSWNKPIGVSHVYMMLIGGGGSGDGSGTGGGSGAVTVWYGAAQHVPDTLAILVPSFNQDGGNNTYVWARNAIAPTTSNFLLRAQGSNSSAAGAADSANQFTASGFFQSVAGQDGSAGSITASATTFLSGGIAVGLNLDANYGYSSLSGGNQPGFFMLQPIIVGLGGVGTRQGGIGCGGGATVGSGGQGMVLIASW